MHSWDKGDEETRGHEVGEVEPYDQRRIDSYRLSPPMFQQRRMKQCMIPELFFYSPVEAVKKPLVGWS